MDTREENSETGVVKNVSAWATVAALALLLALTACNPCARLARKCPPVESVRDSVWSRDTLIRERWLTDTVVVVKLVPEYIQVDVSGSDTAYAVTRYAWARAWWLAGNIRLEMGNRDSAGILMKQIRELRWQISERGSSTATKEVQTVYKTRGIVAVLAWVGGVALVLVALLILARIFLGRLRM